MNCQDISAAMNHYVDGELSTADALALEAHLMDCHPCRERYDSLMNVVGSVRASHPLYTAPPESLLEARRQIHAHHRKQLIIRSVIAAAAMVAVSLGLFAISRRDRTNDSFAAFAAVHHVRYAQGALPLDIRSADPHEVTGWLQGRLPFRVVLPDYPDLPAARQPYKLVGARLVQYRDQDVGYLTYEVGGRPVSLLITSADRTKPSGKPAQQIGRLTFFTTAHSGFQSISWVDQGLCYALVSDLGAASAESCIICHATAAEQRKFAPLRTSRM